MTRALVAALCTVAGTAAPRPATAAEAKVDIHCSIIPDQCSFTNVGSIPGSACVKVRVIGPSDLLSNEACSGTLDPRENVVVALTFRNEQPSEVCRGGTADFPACHIVLEDEQVSVEGARKWLEYAEYGAIAAVIIGAFITLQYYQRRTRKLLDKRRGR